MYTQNSNTSEVNYLNNQISGSSIEFHWKTFQIEVTTISEHQTVIELTPCY